jgi:transcriptional regulator GlxA family with amidase domain
LRQLCTAEAIAAIVTAGDVKSHHTLRVKRALDYLVARSADDVSLDNLAANTGADKFHLCRAFRQEVGMPPHAYLTRLRIANANALLAAGQKPTDVATAVGFYDQSQLTRHFRRIVGTTPGRYARHAGRTVVSGAD